ncbi:MAG: hypothetical protein Q9192_005365 [Flavoplaca navasiana]
MHTSALLRAIFAAGNILWQANAQVTTKCDPTKVTCPNDQGLSTDTYSIDFTTTKTLPLEWELANYANVGLGDQGVELTFAKRYDAPTMWTKFRFFFGRVEFVVKAAPGVGIISSMVLLSDDFDEIDWEFLGGATTNVQTNYFGKGYTGTYNRSTSPAVESPQTQYHTYALDWTTEALTWSIDGVVVRTLKAAEADGNGDQYPQSPMKVSLSLWDGGDPDSPTKEWAGGVTPIPPPEPYTMYVKSVKIFNQNPAQQYQYTDKSGSWRSIKVINDIPFSSSSSAAATMAYSLNLGSTSAVPQSSEAMSSMSSISSASTSAASSQHSNGQQSGSSKTTVAAGSMTPKETQAHKNTVPIVTQQLGHRVGIFVGIFVGICSSYQKLVDVTFGSYKHNDDLVTLSAIIHRIHGQSSTITKRQWLIRKLSACLFQLSSCIFGSQQSVYIFKHVVDYAILQYEQYIHQTPNFRKPFINTCDPSRFHRYSHCYIHRFVH